MADHDTDRGYLLDNRQSEAGIRFGALAELFDPVTFRHADRLGIGPGMRCWEVGAGGPSVPLGLAQRVGPTGRVVATGRLDLATAPLISAWGRREQPTGAEA